MVQTLNINEPSPKRPQPREIGFPWSLLFIPALFVLGGLSIPYIFLGAAPIQRRREQKFQSRMKIRNRIVPYGEFRRAVDEGRGTLVVERHSLKGPFRCWWTPDDIYSLCPVPIVEWIECMPNDERYRPLAEWCYRRYTSEETGTAFLIDSIPPRGEARLVAGAPDWLPERFGFLTVVPPKSLHKHSDAEA